MALCLCIYPPFTRAPRSGLYLGFGVHTGTLTRVTDPAAEQGFDSVSRYGEIWRDMERGEDSEPASGCSAERQRLPHDCRRPSKARLSAHGRLLLLLKRILRRFLIYAMDNSPKQRKITIIAVAAILSCTNERSVAMCLSLG